jgi:hypothetical protein
LIVKHSKLAGIKVADHESIGCHYWQEGLSARSNRPLFGSRMAARIAAIRIPIPSIAKPRFGPPDTNRRSRCVVAA